MSTWHPTRLLTGYAWDALTAACFLGVRVPSSLLLLGAGAGTVLRQILYLLPHLEVTAVDLDTSALDAVRENVRPLSGTVSLVEADAYEWTARCGQRFDVVIDDVYAAGPTDVFRPEPIQDAMLGLLRSRAHEDGVVVANLITAAGHRAAYLAARKAYQRLFARVRTVRPPLGCNAVLVGGNDVKSKMALVPWGPRWPIPERRLWARLRVDDLKAVRGE
jgi:spermidine synthase